MARVIVVGAGVVGLSCAVRLLEAGFRVDVLARDLPLETTSAVAAVTGRRSPEVLVLVNTTRGQKAVPVPLRHLR